MVAESTEPAKGQATTTANAGTGDAKTGSTWGDTISEARQRELLDRLAAWDAETDHGDCKGHLTAEDSTAKNRSASDSPGQTSSSSPPMPSLALCTLLSTVGGPIPDLLSAQGVLREAHDDPNVRFSLDLSALHLEGACIRGAHLESAVLDRVHLESATLMRVNLKGAALRWANLGGAGLEEASLEGAALR